MPRSINRIQKQTSLWFKTFAFVAFLVLLIYSEKNSAQKYLKVGPAGQHCSAVEH